MVLADSQLCPKCGRNPHNRLCSLRPRSGKHAPRKIRSFDCETVAGKGIVLFLSSDIDRNRDFLYNADGCELRDILQWIVRAGNDSLNFGFYFDYDVNQIIAMLPDLHKGQIAVAGKVRYHEFRIRHTPGKRFSVSNVATGETATIWDCSGWAQCSFARLCDDWKLGTEAERALIKAMKARRGDFENATRDELIEYTTLECCLLSQWVSILLKLHEDCGISLRAYSGPGSTAGAMIRAREWTPPEVPDHINTIAESAFFGGRSEISCMGPVDGPIYSYDINSAYPRFISSLPEVRGSRWYRTKSYRSGTWGFYRVRWKQPKTACWGLFPTRGAILPSGHKSVSLLYPTFGEGWFHSVEVETALSLCPGSVEILDGWVVEPRGVPFEWIGETANRRLEYKRKGDQRAFPLKVGLNSIYGKLAQHTGQHPLQCMVYAACITAATRGELLRRAYPNGHNVLLLATDGILSTVPLDCEIGDQLGQWEYTEYPNAWLLQAGVYWCGKKIRTRGIDGRSLELSAVDELWKKKRTRAELVLQARRVLSYRLCNAQNKLHLTGTWHTGDRHVRFSPEPRRRAYRWKGSRLLTTPAPVDEYRVQVLLDQLGIDAAPESRYDESEAMPDWAMDE